MSKCQVKLELSAFRCSCSLLPSFHRQNTYLGDRVCLHHVKFWWAHYMFIVPVRPNTMCWSGPGPHRSFGTRLSIVGASMIWSGSHGITVQTINTNLLVCYIWLFFPTPHGEIGLPKNFSITEELSSHFSGAFPFFGTCSYLPFLISGFWTLVLENHELLILSSGPLLLGSGCAYGRGGVRVELGSVEIQFSNVPDLVPEHCHLINQIWLEI